VEPGLQVCGCNDFGFAAESAGDDGAVRYRLDLAGSRLTWPDVITREAPTTNALSLESIA